MAKTHIELPSSFHFEMAHHVQLSDLNYGMHLGADKILPIALEAQMQFLHSLGYDGLREIEGHTYIMVDSEIQFKSQAHYNQQLKVELSPANFQRCSFELLCRMSDASTGQEVSAVKMGFVFFDYKNQRTIDVPAAFRNQFAAQAE